MKNIIFTIWEYNGFPDKNTLNFLEQLLLIILSHSTYNLISQSEEWFYFQITQITSDPLFPYNTKFEYLIYIYINVNNNHKNRFIKNEVSKF